ncbi:hypothetical protein HYDPIDRAFT_106480 [Hydnomerulius pinastri MD-312]|nr:hypothetical protein HYDPIDRAFT_106480 [Hydnomerulius pinastri MD-312]
MGFCRRCGDIVTGTRCKCGGTAVAPVVQWNAAKGQNTDRWSQTYVSRDKSPTRPPSQIGSTSSSSHSHATSIGSNNDLEQSTSTAPVNRFPRPNSFHSSRSSASLSSRITSHINSATRPPSPLKRPIEVEERSPPPSPTTLAAEAGILQAPHAPELSKAYGSVLQSKESLATYSCAICSTEFQPDATIYPDPTAPALSDRFLCRPCFVTNGGSKGDCPTCHRPVLILKSEGGFVETSGRVWHKKCFRCEGCYKNIGDTPMVDVLGQPSCADCFDNCLKRSITPRKSYESPSFEKVDKRMPVAFRSDPRSREGSPAIDELEQRLGIMKSREGSPVLEELTQRLNAVLNRTPGDSPSMSSTSRHLHSDSRDNSPLMHRTLGRKKSVTFSPPAFRSGDAGDDSFDFDSPRESRTMTPSRTIHERFGSPERDHTPPSGRPSLDAIEEMKRRFMKQASPSLTSLVDSTSSPDSLSDLVGMTSPTSTPSRIPRISRMSGSPALRHAVSASSLRSSRMSWAPSTPDLIPDVSDTMTQSSGPSSPPAFSPQVHPNDIFSSAHKEYTSTKDASPEHGQRSASGTMTPKPRDSLSRLSIPAATLSPGSLCAKCGGSLFATGGGGRFVTVPELSTTGPPKTYHTECFRCTMCEGPFKENSSGQAVFVRGEGGACHVECAPPERTYIKSTAVSSPIKSAYPDLPPTSPLLPVTNTIQTTKTLISGTTHTQPLKGSPNINGSPYSSSRYERPPPSAPAVSAPYSRFGSSAACPGCQKSVSPMEMGVVPGPQGSRWHAACLVCGGKGAGKGRRDKSQPGCGKKLDSAAKRDTEGGVWCRECLLLLPLHMRNPQVESPTKPLVPSFTGRSTGGGPFVAPQFTGTTTIARQFTGRGGVDAGIMRQLTGGGLSPTRQLTSSPTKQLGLATPRPRPKSVIGMRSGKSVDEGRGMFLVRQMTGGGGSFAV